MEHTADAGLRARGDSLEELLVACAEGMFAILVETDQPLEPLDEEIDISAQDPEDLVHTWLRELLYLFDVEHLVFHRFDIGEASDTHVHALCHGERLDPERHRPGAEIKAVTYHGFKVEHTGDGWLAEVLFDV
ncbi:MAG: archease [Candidatus Brocadiia bacterium]